MKTPISDQDLTANKPAFDGPSKTGRSLYLSWCYWLASIMAVLLAGTARAQIQTAGTLFVNWDATTVATNLPASLLDITNTGTLGGFFESRIGTAGATLGNAANGSVIVSANNVNGVQLTASVVMQLRAGTNGPLIPPPLGLVGPNATASIEVWALNPAVLADECMVSWGRRGFAGQNMAFEYGNDQLLGAVTHGTAPDLAWDANGGWSANGGAPISGYWHHLVYTYNGTTENAFVDGALVNSKVGAINIATNAGIMLGAQWTNSGTVISTLPVPATLTIARVRIHDGALTPSQVLNNFNFEKATFIPTAITPQFLSAGPVHRYSFNEPETNDATGLAIHDSIGAAHGAVRGTNALQVGSFSHGRLIMLASATTGGATTGPQSRAAYGDLPNGLLSVNSTNNGGSGEVSIEVWYKEIGGVGNARVFDIGSCGLAAWQNTSAALGLEVTDVGGRPSNDSGMDYFFYTSSLVTAGANSNARRLSWQNRDILPGAGTTNSTAPSSDVYSMLTHQTDRHVVVTWKESTGLITAYENGLRVAGITVSNAISSINDVNVWLGRSMLTDAEFSGEYDEVRFYNHVLSPAEVVGNFQVGPDTVNTSEQAVAIITQPQSVTNFQGSAVSFYVFASASPAASYQWRRNGSAITGATNYSYSLAAISSTNNGDVYSCILSNVTSTATNMVTSSGATLDVIPNQAPAAQFLHETRDGDRDNFTGTIGGTFTTGTNPAVVTHLGYYDLNHDGLTRDHRVGIFNSSGSTLLTSLTVPAGTGAYLTNGYRWVALANPFVLNTNTLYILATETFSGSGDGWCDTFVPGQWNPYFVGANDGTTRNGRFFTGGVWPQVPASANTADNTYGPCDLATLPIGPATAFMPQSSVTNYSGLSLTLPAFVNGEAPVSAQWYKWPSTLLTGQTNSSLFIPVLTGGDSGDYYVIASNSFGPLQSSNVTLTVLPGTPVTIAQQDPSATVSEGFPVSFSVVAAGTPPFTYQWSRNGTPVGGATRATFAIAAATLAMNGDTFFCVVSNVADAVAYSATSTNVTLTVVPNKATPTEFLCTTFDGNRDNFTGDVGGSFLVGSSDALVTHLGFYDLDGDGLSHDHHVGIFDANGTLLTSVVVPAGTGSFLTNGYRWVALNPFFILTNNTTYQLAAEVVSGDGDGWPDLAIPASWNSYYVGANNGSSRSARFSSGAWLGGTLAGSNLDARYGACNLAVLSLGLFSASIQPTNVTVYAGDSVSFSALVNGQAPLTIQWYKAPSTLLGGQTNTTLTLTGLTAGDAGDYYLEGTNPLGSTPSSSVHVTVLPLTPPIITQQPQPVAQTVYIRQMASITVAAIGRQPLSYQWMLGATPISGATNSTLTVPDASGFNVGNYSVTITNVLGATNSDPATLAVLAPPTGSYLAAILSENPLLYYRFSDIYETNVTFNFGSLGAAYNGTYEGSYTPVAGPQPPSFPIFEATNNAYNDETLSPGGVKFPAFNLSTIGGPQTTFAAWVYSTAPQSSFASVFFSRLTGQSCGLGVKSLAGQNELEYHWNDGQSGYESGLILPDAQWVFVALVVEPTKATLYMNTGTGMQTATNVTAHAVRPVLNPGYVGWDTFGTRRWYGSIDEAMIFDRALSPVEIGALYSGTVIVPVHLDMTRSGNDVILSWLIGTLQQADDVTGPYADMTGQTSPYITTPATSGKFYRVRVQ